MRPVALYGAAVIIQCCFRGRGLFDFTLSVDYSKATANARPQHKSSEFLIVMIDLLIKLSFE